MEMKEGLHSVVSAVPLQSSNASLLNWREEGVSVLYRCVYASEIVRQKRYEDDEGGETKSGIIRTSARRSSGRRVRGGRRGRARRAGR